MTQAITHVTIAAKFLPIRRVGQRIMIDLGPNSEIYTQEYNLNIEKVPHMMYQAGVLHADLGNMVTLQISCYHISVVPA